MVTRGYIYVVNNCQLVTRVIADGLRPRELLHLVPWAVVPERSEGTTTGPEGH